MTTTLFEEIYFIFFDKIIHDKEFFQYAGVDELEAMEIAKERSEKLLMESISRLTLSCTPDVDFHNYDLDLKLFNFSMTHNEKDLITSIMKEKLLEQDELKLKAQTNYFNTKDLEIFSPANERRTFMDMYDGLVEKNSVAISNYSSRDRLTGKYKTLNFNYE